MAEEMTIWVVMDGDHNDVWIVAAYTSEALAQDHVDRTGEGWVSDVPVLSALPDTVVAIDPIAAKAARERAQVEARAKYQAAQERAKEEATRIEALTLEGRQNAKLCHCRTFSRDEYLITRNGFCRYCYGWTPEAFRAHFGDDRLAHEIDRLAEPDRIKMRELTGLMV